MPFSTLSARLQHVASRALAHCKAQYGSNGTKVEEPIDPAIGWRPTFFLKPSKFRIVAVEVEDNLYPEILKGAAYDISHYDFPISVYQACTLEAFQKDPRHHKIKQLKDRGFGIITVDDDGTVDFQHKTIPLAQYIPLTEFDRGVSGLAPTIKNPLRAAYDTYLVNEGQGLQLCGQIVEGLIKSIGRAAVKKGTIVKGLLSNPLADLIDELYNKFVAHRATLGDARGFIKDFRNIASHAPNSGKQAAEKIRKCKTGFLDGVDISRKLRDVSKKLNFPVKLHLP